MPYIKAYENLNSVLQEYQTVRCMRKDNTMKVSIILCTYNGAEKIRETIESLLNQDYPQHKLEIIVVNDGSTDRTAEIIGKYPLK